MKDTFNGWSTVGDMEIDVVADLIVTGKKAIEAGPDRWIISFMGDNKVPLKVLDFGCGFGRNAFNLAMNNRRWDITGYDNSDMLSKTEEFRSLKYPVIHFRNLEFLSDWDMVKIQKFDCIYCTLVLQHIYEEPLKQYLADFKNMTKRLLVSGRRFNDDKENRSTWTIIEEAGLIPDEFYSGYMKIDYKALGESEDHNFAVYSLP